LKLIFLILFYVTGQSLACLRGQGPLERATDKIAKRENLTQNLFWVDLDQNREEGILKFSEEKRSQIRKMNHFEERLMEIRLIYFYSSLRMKLMYFRYSNVIL
jgi:hypothetical protein